MSNKLKVSDLISISLTQRKLKPEQLQGVLWTLKTKIKDNNSEPLIFTSNYSISEQIVSNAYNTGQFEDVIKVLISKLAKEMLSVILHEIEGWYGDEHSGI